MLPMRMIALATRLRAQAVQRAGLPAAVRNVPPSVSAGTAALPDGRDESAVRDHSHAVSCEDPAAPADGAHPARSRPAPGQADGGGNPDAAAQPGRVDLALNAQDVQAFDAWRKTLAPDAGRQWISVGPGGKKPVNFWPIDRYEQLVRRLIERYDIWPVVFGGNEDIANAQRLVAAWGRGHIAAGALGLRTSAVAMRNCAFHVGNDTGTMHLAAAAPVRCVGIFSAHAPPGQWSPYGPGHIVLRKTIECEACGLWDCVERKMECILSISVDEVFQACATMMQSRPHADAAGLSLR